MTPLEAHFKLSCFLPSRLHLKQWPEARKKSRGWYGSHRGESGDPVRLPGTRYSNKNTAKKASGARRNTGGRTA